MVFATGEGGYRRRNPCVFRFREHVLGKKGGAKLVEDVLGVL